MLTQVRVDFAIFQEFNPAEVIGVESNVLQHVNQLGIVEPFIVDLISGGGGGG